MTKQKSYVEENGFDGDIRELDCSTLHDLLSEVYVGKVVEVKLSELLRLNGNKKRGKRVVEAINGELQSRGLVARPEIEKADKYSVVTILDARDLNNAPMANHGWPVSSLVHDDAELYYADKNTTLKEVITKMVMSDYSQIPVLSNSGRNLEGTVTWKSIALGMGDRDSLKAKDVMEKGGLVFDSDENLMDIIDDIFSAEYAYFRAADKTISGIVTATDLAMGFENTTGAFMRVGEIENITRSFVNRISLPDLKGYLNQEWDESRGGIFLGGESMTFGEYKKVLEDPIRWKEIGFAMDRKYCIAALDSVREIRNDIMHFRNGLNNSEDLRKIDSVLAWLRTELSIFS